jgi:hypothetical protein
VNEVDRQLAVRVRDALRSAAQVNSVPARERSDAAGWSLEELPFVVRFGESSKPELVSEESGVRGALVHAQAAFSGMDRCS